MLHSSSIMKHSIIQFSYKDKCHYLAQFSSVLFQFSSKTVSVAKVINYQINSIKAALHKTVVSLFTQFS